VPRTGNLSKCAQNFRYMLNLHIGSYRFIHHWFIIWTNNIHSYWSIGFQTFSLVHYWIQDLLIGPYWATNRFIGSLWTPEFLLVGSSNELFIWLIFCLLIFSAEARISPPKFSSRQCYIAAFAFSFAWFSLLCLFTSLIPSRGKTVAEPQPNSI